MKINRLKTKEILDFEKEIGYELVVNERMNTVRELQWEAYFENARVYTRDGFISCDIGEGADIDKALKSYCDQISRKVLVFNSNTKDRVEIKVPTMVHTRRVEDGEKLKNLGRLCEYWRGGCIDIEPLQAHDDDTWDYWLEQGKFKPLLAIRTKPEPIYVFKNVVVPFDQFVEILEKAKF